jgi:hypothetical protein
MVAKAGGSAHTPSLGSTTSRYFALELEAEANPERHLRRSHPLEHPLQDLEGVFVALGCEVYPNRAGSRVAVVLNGCKYSYHRPHPENEIGRKTVRDVRDFLTAAGVAS